MADQESASAEKAKRTVAILKLTGRNEEGNEPRTIGEAIHAVFADCSEAGSNGDLEDTDPVVLRALVGWLSLDDALAELPTGARDEQQRRPSPEDGAVLKNGERQGERGHPPGGALAPAASPQPLKSGAGARARKLWLLLFQF